MPVSRNRDRAHLFSSLELLMCQITDLKNLIQIRPISFHVISHGLLRLCVFPKILQIDPCVISGFAFLKHNRILIAAYDSQIRIVNAMALLALWYILCVLRKQLEKKEFEE